LLPQSNSATEMTIRDAVNIFHGLMGGMGRFETNQFLKFTADKNTSTLYLYGPHLNFSLQLKRVRVTAGVKV